MYIPKNFNEKNMETMLEFIQNYPFAALVINGVNGLSAEHIPFIVKAESNTKTVLQAHIAKPNPPLESYE